MSRHRGSRVRPPLFLVLVALACRDNTGPTRTPQDLHMVSGDAQTTRRGDDVAEPLRVRVIASDGEPLGDAVVQWAVTQGTAVLNPGTSTTNAAGEAETRITNVGTIGAVQVRASVQGPTTGSGTRTFSITALDPCLIAAMVPYGLGDVVSGVLRPLDCTWDDGSHWDFYALTLGAQQAVVIRVQSDSITPPHVGLWDRSNGRARGATFTTATEAVMKAILAPGSYGIGVSSLSFDLTGPYDLTSSLTSISADLCQIVFVVRGIATAQQLASSDCVDRSGPWYDRFSLALYPDERVIVTQSSTEFRPRLQLVHRLTDSVVAEADANATGTATLDYTAPLLAIYRIHASSTVAQKVGAYTLAVSHPPGPLPNVTPATATLAVSQPPAAAPSAEAASTPKSTRLSDFAHRR